MGKEAGVRKTSSVVATVPFKRQWESKLWEKSMHGSL